MDIEEAKAQLKELSKYGTEEKINATDIKAISTVLVQLERLQEENKKLIKALINISLNIK